MAFRPEFYSTAAQLIPLLLVAAAVDTRMWASTNKQPHGEVVFDILTLFMLTLAWMVAMSVVATGKQGSAAEVVVALGLAMGWIQVVSSIALHQIQRLGHAKVTRRLRMWLVLLIAAPLVGAGVVWTLAYL